MSLIRNGRRLRPAIQCDAARAPAGMEIDFIAILRAIRHSNAPTTVLPRFACLVSTVLAAALPVSADAQVAEARALAAGCASCHQPGHRTPPPLAGRPRGELLALLAAFRNGSRDGTVMPKLARGYTPAQLDAIAAWYAAQQR